jgi:glycosyltransferase involved in cell wall biosynthesis
MNVDEIAAALLRLSEDLTLQSELQAKGAVRVAHFSWSEAVEKTWRVYQELSD